jgi:ABC-type lipoprotein export system ATPase subunit
MGLNYIHLQQIKKIFYEKSASRCIINEVTYRFQKGKSYALMGASGAGKSTLLHIAAGLEEPTSGNVYFNNDLFFVLSPQERDRYTNGNLGFVFQFPYLIQELTVLENVIIKGIIGLLPYETCKKKALDLLSQVGLSEKAQSLPSGLSGGQQQRVSLARALLNEPDFIFADEPTGNLDEQTGNHIINLLLEYQQQQSMGIIISTHDWRVAKKMQRVMHLRDGTLEEYDMQQHKAASERSLCGY